MSCEARRMRGCRRQPMPHHRAPRQQNPSPAPHSGATLCSLKTAIVATNYPSPLAGEGGLRSRSDEGAPQAIYAAPSRSTPTKPLTRPPFGGHPLPQGERDTGISYAPRGWKEVLANNNQTILLPSPEKAFRNSLFVLKFED